MQSPITPIYLRFGGAIKSVFEMSKEEVDAAAVSILRRAKEKAFSKGRPIIFGKEGRVYEEWSDGRIVERK
jgi:hypothetical protein